jgi:hypothetical protein
MKMTWVRKARLILLEAVLLVGLIWLLTLSRTEMIIRYGIRSADTLRVVYWAAWGVLAVGLNAAYIFGARRRKKQREAEPIRLTFAPDSVLAPAEIRAELLRFQGERPQLAQLLAQGLSQLDNIDRKQAKMAELIARNDVNLLSQAQEALTSAEQTLCRKLVLVLNRALLCDPLEVNPRRREAVFAEHARAMQVFLTENEDVLNRCETLLTETVRYVEEKKAGRETMDLQVMTDVIRSLANDGIRMDAR